MRRLVCVLIAAVGCAHVDAEAARRSLLQADADFDRAVAERGVEAWVEAFAEDAAMFPRNQPLVRGHEKIRAEMAALGDPRKAPPDLKVRWKPLGAQVSADGTLGWTWGNAHLVSTQGEQRAKYVTVWRRAPNGAWKVVADIGTAGDAEPGAGPD
jgi:ketosteroid isomerase-like protein